MARAFNHFVSEFWLDRANEARAIAAKVTDREAKLRMSEIAVTYDQLAFSYDQIAKRPEEGEAK
jgi:hypothetical protein